ncbi:MAG TPA: hypothetical protein VN933_07150 [Candidatus Eremiobacteraceae bacterium]|jgi:hypothetical protein|nr:hypothetical protein [Candidatus Eremiobacteraceae bacterium]
MNDRIRRIPAVALIAGALALMPISGSAQNSAKSSDSSSHDRWLHVRVDNPESKDEIVRVNVPLELAEKILPTIDKDKLHNGKVRVDHFDCNGVDFHALMNAVRDTKDGEFVTVQSKEQDVRVAKQNNYFLVHVLDKEDHKHSAVEVKIPMKVVDALFSAGKDEVDLVAGLHALALQGDTELVSVKDHDQTVRVWLDSKNVSD